MIPELLPALLFSSISLSLLFVVRLAVYFKSGKDYNLTFVSLLVASSSWAVFYYHGGFL